MIKLENLSLSIDRINILNGIDLKIDKGDLIGIIGPNGSGKSSLLRCIYRVMKKSGGKIYFEDKDIDNLSIKDTSKKLAVVSQHNEYNFDFTVFDMVMMGRSPYKKFLDKDTSYDIDIALNSLETVGMIDFKDRNYSSLSGGEKQGVILARALCQKAEYLVLDEPTNHLDIKHQLEFMEVVKNLNITVIAAIHDLNIALKYCNKICAIKEGKVVAYGTKEEVITPKIISKLFGVNSKIIADDETGIKSVAFTLNHI
ncbi:ABC transporter ATP-binding protein [Maledivibacter halophilus]|uniref:Iron complex transport system ATP-binding protein n=1 Tax=Maledivibacter halophilus TaxID=36842 RepID=A0A1T5MWT8_9FIRM|nr:ABC transporter ATP-binding protein [Maledivibacter halophilus]SKC92463.1 iron complex transport system ATP-binding protein [Maledivibacter halophilus]